MTAHTIPPFMVIGISIRTTNENGQSATDIPALWERFFAESISFKVPNKIDDTVYSIYTDYEKDHTLPYTTLLGCAVSSLDMIPDQMVGKMIDGGSYLKISAERDQVFATWQNIWASKIPRIFTADLEIYTPQDQNPSEAKVDIMVAVG